MALGDGPASGFLQLAVTPYQTEVPIRSQIEFKVLAWNSLGKRIEPKPAWLVPVWSVLGGGIINRDGLFTANEVGGPFRVTATQGSSQAHALVEVSGTHFDYFMLDYPAIAVEDRAYDADPDGDRRTNLAEYALGGAPDLTETYYELGLQHELVRWAGNWYAEFRYPQRRDAVQLGLRYEFQVSDDLSSDSWMDRGYTVLEITSMDEIFEEVRLRIDRPVGSANTRMFGRVKIYLDE